MRASQYGTFVVVSALLGAAGCHHIGPKNIVADRIPYNEAIADSWKQQTLLNVVRLRYSDIPEFVDVPSILAGYGLDQTVTNAFGYTINPSPPFSTASFGLGRTKTVSDRPTITFSPQTGSAFTRNLINPIPPASILNLIESGNPADVVLDLGVESINGIRNRQFIGGKIRPCKESCVNRGNGLLS